MLKQSVCDYSYTHILVKKPITFVNTAAGADENNVNKKTNFKTWHSIN